MMKLLRAALIGLLIGSQAYAGLPPTTIMGQSDTGPKTKFGFQIPFNQFTDLGGIKALIETGNQNILKDPGFESGTTNNVTISGGSLATVNGIAKLTGAYGMDWDSNAAGQTATGAAITIPVGLQGKNAVVSCNIYTVSGTATHTLAAYDGTTAINPTTITSVAGKAIRTSVNFIMPSSGTITWQMKSVASNEPEIYVDDCFLEEAGFFNIGSGTIANNEQSYTPTLTNAGTSPTSVNFAYSRIADKVYIRGSFVAGTSPAASVLTVSLPSGLTVDASKISNAIYQVVGHGNAQLGQTTWSLLPIVTGGASVISFSRTDQTTFTPMNGSNLLVAGDPVSFVAIIPVSQYTDQGFYKPDQTPASWSGYQTVSSGWTQTSTTYAAPAAGSSIVTTALTSRNITCSSDGTAAGISCVLPRGGIYQVSADVCTGTSAASTASFSACRWICERHQQRRKHRLCVRRDGRMHGSERPVQCRICWNVYFPNLRCDQYRNFDD
jgi:hypothetical protein